MSVALYIVAKKKLKDVDLFVDGKAVGRANELELDQLCAAAGVPSLMEFVSQDPDELEDFLEDEGIEGDLPKEEWYPAEAGLSLVRPLIAHLKANPTAIEASDAILSDLIEYEAIFVVLAQKKSKWHFAIDF